MLLREQAGLLMIGVDPSSSQLSVLPSHPAQALSTPDLVGVIHQKGARPGSLERKEK